MNKKINNRWLSFHFHKLCKFHPAKPPSSCVSSPPFTATRFTSRCTRLVSPQLVGRSSCPYLARCRLLEANASVTSSLALTPNNNEAGPAASINSSRDEIICFVFLWKWQNWAYFYSSVTLVQEDFLGFHCTAGRDPVSHIRLYLLQWLFVHWDIPRYSALAGLLTVILHIASAKKLQITLVHLNPRTQMHGDQEKNKNKNNEKQKKECQALGNQLRTFSDDQNSEENYTVGVLERINNWHNEIFAVFLSPSVKGVVFPTRCACLLHKY